MMGKEHKEVLQYLEGRYDKDGKEKVTGIIPTLLSEQVHLDNYYIESNYKDKSGKSNKCYLVTKMGAELLAHTMTGAKGILFSAKYVERFNQMEEALQNQQPKLPSTYKEALVQLLAQVEENEKLEQENKLLLEENKTNKPKADYFDNLVEKNLLLIFRDTA